MVLRGPTSSATNLLTRALVVSALLWLPTPATTGVIQASSEFAQTTSELTGAVHRLLESETKAYAFSLLDPHSGLRIRINADRPFPAASTMKIGVLLALYRRIERGQNRSSERVGTRNSFLSVADGSRYSVPPEQSEECACLVYRSRQRSLPLGIIARDMIQSSSNLATNILIRHLGAQTIQKELTGMGLRRLHVVRGLYDMKAFERDVHNTLTADAAMRAFHILRGSKYFSWKHRREMLQSLAHTEHRDKLPSFLPSATIVSQKSGYTEGVSHDAGLVYAEPNRPYAIAILTEGHRDRYVLEERMGMLSRRALDAVLKLRGARNQLRFTR